MRGCGALAGDERHRLHRVLEACPDLAIARELAGEFHAILRARTGHTDLGTWTQRALLTGSRPVQGIAAFPQNDGDAAVAGLSQPWNSGVVEGHVTRVKLIKRRCHGRASLPPLHTLLLAQTP